MLNVRVKIKKLRPDVKLPAYALPGDAGMDIFSNEADVIIEPNQRHIFATGWALEYPEGYATLIWDKSGLSGKHGLKVMGGVFEYTYRGEYMICLLNTSDQPYQIKKGEKIAQMIIQPINTAELEEVTELSESVRGEGRHGHTGK
ncbi:MAG: dUTP diphosphatase [Candidatus Komeilibacteria bacterium]